MVFQLTFWISETDRSRLRTHQSARVARGVENIPRHLYGDDAVSPTSLAYCLPAPWKGCTPVGTSSVLSSHSVISLCSTLFFFAIPRLGGSESEAIEPAYAFTLQDVEVLLKYKTQDHLVCNKGFKGICQGYRKNKLCLS